jgi:hypothetical protein
VQCDLLNPIRTERLKIESSNAELQQRVQSLQEKQSVATSDLTHQAPFQQLGTVEAEIKALRKEQDGLENADALAGGVDGMVADVAKWKTESQKWTDIYCMESHLSEWAGGDKETMERIRRECYGTLYVEGEGLLGIDVPDLPVIDLCYL